MKIKVALMSAASVLLTALIGAVAPATPALAAGADAVINGLVVTNQTQELYPVSLWPEFSSSNPNYTTITGTRDLHFEADLSSGETLDISVDGATATQGASQDVTVPQGISDVTLTVHNGAASKAYNVHIASKSAPDPELVSIAPNTGTVNGGDEIQMRFKNFPTQGANYNNARASNCSFDNYFVSSDGNTYTWAGQTRVTFDEAKNETVATIVVPAAEHGKVAVVNDEASFRCDLYMDSGNRYQSTRYNIKVLKKAAYTYTTMTGTATVKAPAEVTFGSGLQIAGNGINFHALMDEETSRSLAAYIVDPANPYSQTVDAATGDWTTRGSYVSVSSWTYTSNDSANMYIRTSPDYGCYDQNGSWINCNDFLNVPGPRDFVVVQCIAQGYDVHVDGSYPCDFAHPVIKSTINWVSPAPRNVSFTPNASGLEGRGSWVNNHIVKGITVKGQGMYYDGDYGVKFPNNNWGGIEVKSLAQYVRNGNGWNEADNADWGSEDNYIQSRVGSYENYTTGFDTFSVIAPSADSSVSGPLWIYGQGSDNGSYTKSKFTYAGRPVVSSVSPAAVSAAGGSVLTLTGSNFGKSGLPSVTVNGLKASCVTRISDTKVTAVVPASSPATAVTGAEVSILPASGAGAPEAPGSIDLTSPGAAPVVSAPSAAKPAAASTVGGTLVTVTGSGFGPAGTVGVTVGGECAKVTASTATSVTFEAPAASAAGLKPIVVSSITGSKTIANAIKYSAPAGVTTVAPAIVSSALKSQLLTVTGLGFGKSGTIKVGSQKAVAYTSKGTSISKVAFTPGNAGTITVVVTPKGAKTPLTSTFTVVAPAISYVGPEYGLGARNPEFVTSTTNSGVGSLAFPIQTGTVVRIDGANFGATGGKLKVGTAIVPTTLWSNSKITFTAPGTLPSGLSNISIVPAGGKETAVRTLAVTFTPNVNAPLITNVHLASDASVTTFDQLDSSASDLYTIEGLNLKVGAIAPTVEWLNADIYTMVNVPVVTHTATSVTVRLPRDVIENALYGRWEYGNYTRYLSLTISNSNGASTMQYSINYTTYPNTPSVSVNQTGNVCLKDNAAVMAGGTQYSRAQVTVYDQGAFGNQGVQVAITDTDGEMALDASAVTNTDSDNLVVDFANLTGADISRPWGSKSIRVTNVQDGRVHSYSLNCKVTPALTTRVDNGASATFDAGTALLAKMSTKSESSAPYLATSVLTDNSVTVPVDVNSYQYTLVSDYNANHRSAGDFPNARNGLPVAAGDYYIRMNLSANGVSYDRTHYSIQQEQGTANFAHVTLTGKDLTLTPKLKNSSASTLVYSGALTADKFDVTNLGGEALTSVNFQYKHHSCTNDWTSGLPTGVAVAPGCTSGTPGDADSWDIRVANFTMGTDPATGLDKNIAYFWPTSSTGSASNPIFNLTITPKPVSLGAVEASKGWDGTTDVNIASVEVVGAVDGDSLSISSSSMNGAAFASSNAGAGIAITHSTFTLNSSNYSLTNGDKVITGTIRKANATIGVTTRSAKFCGTSFPCSIDATVVVLDSATGSNPGVGNALPTPTFTTSGTARCAATYANGTVTITAQAAGDCVLTARQAGSVNYNTAVSANDSSLNDEIQTIRFIGAPKKISVVADDSVTDYQSIIDNGGVDASVQIQGLLAGDTFDESATVFDLVKGSVHKSLSEMVTLCATPANCIGTWTVVPSGATLSNLTAADSAAYSSVAFVNGKLIITDLPPVISAITGGSGPEAGGNTVTITGTGFTSVTSISVGGVTLRKPKFALVDGALVFTAPAGHGVVDLVLSAGDASASDVYTYVAPNEPKADVKKLSPQNGVKAGGFVVTATGTHLDQVTSIKIGTTTLGSSDFHVDETGTQITFVMPAGEGSAKVSFVANFNTDKIDYLYKSDKAPALDLNLKLDVGAKLKGAAAVLVGGGLKANSKYTLVMHSKAVVIYTGTSNGAGNFTQNVTMPGKSCVDGGKHELTLTGIAPNGQTVVSTQYIALTDTCKVLALSDKPLKTISTTDIGGFLFDYASSYLDDVAKASLKDLLPLIVGAKSLTITGYTQTDLTSDAAKLANKQLAKERAQAVSDYLKSLGVTVSVKLVAAGATDPVSTTKQKLNRRVNIDINFLKM